MHVSKKAQASHDWFQDVYGNLVPTLQDLDILRHWGVTCVYGASCCLWCSTPFCRPKNWEERERPRAANHKAAAILKSKWVAWPKESGTKVFGLCGKIYLRFNELAFLDVHVHHGASQWKDCVEHCCLSDTSYRRLLFAISPWDPTIGK